MLQRALELSQSRPSLYRQIRGHIKQCSRCRQSLEKVRLCDTATSYLMAMSIEKAAMFVHLVRRQNGKALEETPNFLDN